VAFSSDGLLLAYADDAGSIGLWDIARAYKRNKLSITAHSVAGQYSPTVTAITFEPKKWKLWYVVDGGPVGAWDISAIPATNRNISTQDVGLILSPNISGNIAISPNNDLLARIKDDIQFWSLPNFAQLYNLRNEDTLSFAISQNIFARSGANCEIRICNLINGEVRDTLTGHTKRILSMDFSPDGGLLVTGSEDNTVRARDVAAKKQIYGHSEKVLDVIYLPFSDRKLVASGSNDCTVRIWDYGFEKEIDRIDNYLGEYRGLSRRMSFCRQNNLLAVATKVQRLKFGKCSLARWAVYE
jgi:WD40 repeat protein